MTRQSLFTDNTNLLMHLSSIGSLGVRTKLSSEIAFAEQPIEEITLDLCSHVGNETILMCKEANLEVGAVDFEHGQLVLVPMG